MMNEPGKSDRPVVPKKSPNKTGQPVAEGMEGRGLAKGNPPQQNASRTPGRNDAPSALERIRQAAKKDRKLRFTALLHHIYNLETLRMVYFSIKREAAPGVDGETWRRYGESLEANLRDLSARLKRGAYRAKPVRRVYIPKADGRQRPLGVTALEDKIVQRATVEVLNAIYETDFLGFSYGFRPGRSPHHALDALYTALLTRKVNWVLDVDIRSFFDTISHEWLVKFLEHRIADRRVVRLIQKWLSAWRAGGRETDTSGRGDAAGWKCLAAAGQHLLALRVRPLGPVLASEASAGRHDRCAIRRRRRGGISGEVGCRTVLGRADGAIPEVFAGTAS